MAAPTVLVIGAGIGGIATAARLAHQGYRVTVVEKNAQQQTEVIFVNADTGEVIEDANDNHNNNPF